jgi:hypothetical protein
MGWLAAAFRSMQTTLHRRHARTRGCRRECLFPQDLRLVESTRGTVLQSVGLGSGLGLAALGRWALAAIDLGLG